MAGQERLDFIETQRRMLDRPIRSSAERITLATRSPTAGGVGGGHCPWLKHAKSMAPLMTRFLHEHT